jgi:hypothetical protein
VTDQLLWPPAAPGPVDRGAQESARLERLAEYGVVPLGSPERASPADKVLLDLRGIAELAQLICGVEIAMVNLIDADHQHVLAAQGVCATTEWVSRHTNANACCGRWPASTATVTARSPAPGSGSPRFTASPKPTTVILTSPRPPVGGPPSPCTCP